MKNKFILLVGMLMLGPAPLLAQGTAFTYQGRLTEDASPPSGLYDFRFTLFDKPTNGTDAASPLELLAVPVTNGLFMATLDFGPGVFTGPARWLEIAVKNSFTDNLPVVLTPRQPITATPYALHAVNAAGLMSFTSAPLDIKVNGQRVLRLEASGGAPNLIGGLFVNSVGADVEGATIGGGGSPGGPNQVEASFSTVGGGSANSVRAGATASTIGGGLGNLSESNSPYSTISGGAANVIQPNTSGATIGGGADNVIEPAAHSSTIAGGWFNTIQSNAYQSTISGGWGNSIQSNASSSTMAGGLFNSIGPNATAASVGGGEQNHVSRDAYRGVIAGGTRNVLFPNAHESVIGGGSDNRISSSAWSTIGGGNDNQIASNSFYATMAGGRSLVIGELANNATIGGGDGNTIGAQAAYASIGGGGGNRVEAISTYATVAGGSGNHVESFASYSTIGGGAYSVIESNALHATVGGGLMNRIQSRAAYATIPGGCNARAANFGQMAYASGSFAEGGDAQASSYVLRRTTTNDTAMELMLDGDGYFDGSDFLGPPRHRMGLPAGGRWSFDILIVGSANDATTAGYQVRGVIKRAGETTSLVGVPILNLLGADAAAAGWSATVEADDVNDALIIKATGDPAQAVRWVANVRVVELIH